MTLIIAEAGVNHNGSLKMAMQLVDAAVSSGADIVKFQTFKAKNLVTVDASKADYQLKTTADNETQYEMLSRLELSYEDHFTLQRYCHSLGIEFLSTAFDFESLSFLVDDIQVKRLKIPSGELTNSPFVLAHARTGLDIILSTGMASMDEIKKALSIIAFGYTTSASVLPNAEHFTEAFQSPAGQKALLEKVTILHCTTEYPAPIHEINLNVLDSFRQVFSLRVGYSDHSQGITIPIAAVAKGASVIEKHFTLDRNLPGPDHLASLEPLELKLMVDAVRDVERALGDGVKAPSASEIKNKQVARKSIVAMTNISKGQAFSARNLTIKRPGTGMEPDKYWDLIDGKLATREYHVGELIDE